MSRNDATVATRIPKDIEALLPETGIKGLRAQWIRDAILAKLMKEGKLDDSVLCPATEPVPPST